MTIGHAFFNDKNMRCFEELRIWQDARTLVKDIYSITTSWKDYGFKDQLQRAVISIMNNIAEGSDSGSDNLFIRYLQIAKGSCGEVKSMLYVCEDIEYLSPEQAIELRNRVYNISSAIQKLIEYLRKQSNTTK
jgi:four helix bundle protein